MPDSLTNDAARTSQEEEKKSNEAVAAEVAPAQSSIARGPDIKCVEPIRDVIIYIGPDPATDAMGQLGGPSTSDSKIEGPTHNFDVNTEPSEMTCGSGVVSVLNPSVPITLTSSYSCPENKGPSL